MTSPSECSRRGLAGIYPGNDPRIALGSTVAGPQLAPGFKSFGIASFISATGAVVAAGATGGVSTAVIAGVAAGGAAAVGVGVLAASGGSGGTTSGTPTGGAPITAPAGAAPRPPTAPVSTPPTEDVQACFTLNLPASMIEVNQVVAIDGRCSTGGAALFYRYDLGDGRVKEGQPYVTVTWPVPGVYNLTLTVSRNPIPFGAGLLVDEDTLTRTVTVTEAADDTEPTPTPSPGPTGADLSLTKTATPSRVEPDDFFTWTITVQNLGPETAEDVVIVDNTPAGLDLYDIPSECDSFGGEVSGYLVQCSLGNVGPGQSRTVDLEMMAMSVEVVTSFVNDAFVTSETNDSNEANNSASASVTVSPPPTPEADLDVTKTPLMQTVFVRSATWTLTVTNSGPDPATGVVLTDLLPSGFDFGEGSPPNGCTDSGGEGGVVVTCSIGFLGVGNSVTFVLKVETPFPEGAQTYTNRASVTSLTLDTDTSDNFATAMVTVSLGQDSRSLRSSITSDIVAAPRDGATVGNLLLNGKSVATTNNASPFRYTIADQPGKNVIEAHLLTSKEGEVLWRFDFTTAAGFVQRSFIVESGQVVSQDGRTIVFRLDGPGQKIRFRFNLSSR